jgi:transcriptional regulator with XRE-family HTH domain
MSRKATRQVESQRELQHTGFAAKLRQALAEDDLTAEQFARQIDRTLRTVQRWRAGGSEPTGADLVLVARSLNRDPSWFYEEVEKAA